MDKSYTHKEFERRFTKTVDVIKYIAELETLNLSDFSDEQLENIIDKYFYVIPYVDTKILAGHKLYRARLNINNTPFDKVSDITAPQKEYIIEHGRANKIGERIFYCASNAKLALFEVIQDLKYKLKPELEVASLTIGEWRLKADLHVACIIHSPILHQLRKDILDAYNDTQKLITNGSLQEDVVNANNLLCQFFSEQFTKDKIRSSHDYKISAFYASRLRTSNSLIAEQYKSSRFDGLNYPSVAMNYKGDNQALFIQSLEEKLELINTIDVLCGNIDFKNGTFTYGILHEAEKIENGHITWKKEFYKPKAP